MRKTSVLKDAQVECALVVAAHPDDVDFLASGTIARWTAGGMRVVYCIVTDGDAGGFDPDRERAEVPALRREEQLAAAKVVGVDDVRFLGYADGSVEVTTGLRCDLSRAIRQVRPRRVVMHSPEVNWPWLPDFHPDHRATGEATLRAVYPDARNAFAHPQLLRNEGLAPWTVEEIWMVGAPRPNHYVDVTEQFQLKMQALRAHVSQTAHAEDLESTVRERLARQADETGRPGLAEAFHVVTTA
ncbi:PIG-L deacetylase family protein [Streptomyces sp. NPDC005407]|uniref:PIG-L deacetylase family protein n=1 Tax=Streptomyces sp. NPDC005407 TaxID=3155340 RepID=UPI0033A96118